MKNIKNGQKVGYIRVSSLEQNTASQLEALKKCGVEKFFEEKISGKNTKRPELKNLLDYVRSGDTVYVKDLSRLARNTKDLLNLVENFSNNDIRFVSIKENIDTDTHMGKLILTLLGAIYEFERANLLERQRDGIEIAKKLGKYKGRKPIKRPPNFDEIYEKWQLRKIKTKTAMQLLNLSEYAFYKFVNEERVING